MLNTLLSWRRSFLRATSAGLLLGLAGPALAPAADTDAVAARQPERARWSWNRSHAKVTETGDLAWAPEAFHLEMGQEPRYIDFDAGDDANDGTREKPWKHHPWDSAASGNAKNCSGVHTYIFKRGVIYRGTLVARESGRPGDPIRLTSDPAWGTGEAVFSGSQRISGWKQGADRNDIPDAAKIWYVDLPFAPRSIWEQRDGKTQRVPLARTPNWKVSDPNDVLSEWWTWEQPQWWAGKCQIDYQGHRAHIGIDTKHLNHDESFYKDAVVRTEYGIVMGTPFPSRVEGFDAQRKGVIFQGPWFGDTEKIITKNRYYLEDKPQYLDSPGEFWFDKKGNGGRLYIRLADDQDPNQSVVEAGDRLQLIEDEASAKVPPRLDYISPAEVAKVSTAGISHVEISGLTFRYLNTEWDLVQPVWMLQSVDNACIRLLGSTEDVRIANCRFEYVPKAIRIQTLLDPSRIDHVIVSDNEIEYTDHTAISITDNVARPKGASKPRMGDVKVLRNRLYEIGMRNFRQNHDFAIHVETPETGELAGNVLERTYGAGIFVMRGKDMLGHNTADVPLARTLVYNNRVVESLLTANDWGGIEVNGAGAAYVFNNISGAASGYWNWGYQPDKRGGAGPGMAYYLDGGGSKTDVFNNVAWGRTSDPTSKLCTNCAFYEAGPNVLNTYFNNTVYDFAMGSNWSPAGGRHLSLGNIWSGIGSYVWMHGKVKEDKDPPPAGEYPLFSDAYSRNVFERTTPEFAVFEAAGRKHDGIASMAAALSQKQALAQDVGTTAAASPFVDAARHDFRPSSDSAASGRGVKVFVPWALCRTVGEWHFRRNNADATVLLDDHLYAAPYVVDRVGYASGLLLPLKAVNITAADYMAGPLENWTSGALKFNGKDQFAMLRHADMTRPYQYEAAGQKRTASGNELATPDIATSNLLIEAYFRTEPNHTSGTIVSKLAGSGYRLTVNRGGGVTLALQAGDARAEVAGRALVNDGRWHHLLAEVDRAAAEARIYMDGNKVAQEHISLAADASLSNEADLLVGRDTEGSFFAGSLEYLRIARGTLADAHTTVEELYDWEFDGPFLRDFAGRDRDDKIAAGAFQSAR